MSAAFTPGPWLVGTGGGGGATTYVYETGSDGKQSSAIAGCTHEFVERPMAEREANANLIAASPDLFDALSALIAGADAGHVTVAVDNAARAALNKARGMGVSHG